MATCRDCLHHSLCDYNTNISGNGKVRMVYAEGADIKCSFFENRADVVPKSEYHELVCKLECFLCHVTGSRLSKHTYDLRTMETVATDCINETYNDGFAAGYKECAEEIFDEIEQIPRDQPSYVLYVFLTKKIAELKKKYIGAMKDES